MSSCDRKRLRYGKKKLNIAREKNVAIPIKVLLSLLAMGVTMATCPDQAALAADLAGNIVREGGNVNLITNDKADIYADKVSGTVGLNRFEYFTVGNNQIANMYFKQANSDQVLNTLVNTVNNKIDIYGTVNAIRNNQVGGNLYFLSPKGMVVGASGVINAGSLTVMTPTSLNDFKDPGQVLDNIKSASLDPNGAIDIHGAVNAATGIDLRAAAITINKAAGSATAPVLRTGVLFDTVVNDGKIVSSGVKTGNLTAVVDDKGNVVFADPSNGDTNKITGDGSITIAASATKNNTKTTFIGINATNTVQATVEVGEGAEINAAGNVEISATAKRDNVNYIVDFWDLVSFTKAEVSVNGNVRGGDVKITSSAVSEYSEKNYQNLTNILTKGVGETGVNINDKLNNAVWGQLQDNGIIGSKTDTISNFVNQFYMPFGVVDANAITNIGEKAVIKSNIIKDSSGKGLSFTKDSKTTVFGGNMDINAKSVAKNDIKIGIQRQYEKGSQEKANYVTAGFIYEKSDSTAIVNVHGQAVAEQSLAIMADAANTNKLKLAVKKPKLHEGTSDGTGTSSGASMAMVAVGVISQDTTATVNLGAKEQSDNGAASAPKIKASGALSVKSNSANTISSEVIVETNDETALSTAVNVAGSTGNANINDYAAVAGKSVDIQTTNQMKDLSISTDNSFTGEFTGVEWLLDTDTARSGAQSIGEILHLIGQNNQNAAGINVQQAAGGGQGSQSTAGWNEYFDAGASVMVANVTNNAITNIEPTVGVIATGGDAAVGAKVVIDDSSLITNNILVNKSEDTKVGVAAAVAVENMHNTAQVNIKSDGDHKAQVAADKGNVSVTAGVEQQYNRVYRMVADLTDALAKAEEHFTELGAADKFDKVQKIAADIITLSKKDKAKNLKESKKFVGKASAALDIIEQLTGTEDLVNALEAFADAANYTNMYVSAAAKTDEDVGKDATAMATGTVGIQNLHNTADINIGVDTAIKAGADSVAVIKAEVLESNVLGAGKWALIPDFETTGGAENGIGGTVAVQNSDSNSSVTINKGVTIAAGSIDIAADNKVLNIGAALGGAKTSARGITGMVSYMGGTSIANVQVDDDVNFTAKKKVATVTEQDADGKEKAVDKVVSTGDVNIKTNNDTILISAVGDISSSKASSVGVSTGVINYDRIDSLAQVHNIEVDAAGNSVDTAGQGGITANSVNTEALTSGTINNLTVAGVSTGASKNANNAAGGVNVAASGAGAGGVQNAQVAAGNGAQQNSTVQVGAAGSVSWNHVKNNTEALIDNVNIVLARPEIADSVADTNLKNDISTAVHVMAEDSSYIGAYSGAMALSKLSNDNGNKFQGSLAGAVAVNDLTKTTTAALKNSILINSDDVLNKAQNTGAQVAAGLSLGLETGKRGDGVSVNLGASGSANYVDSTVHADMLKNNITGAATTVNNIAYDKDVQVAGGVTAQFAQSSAAVGGAVSVNKVKNNIKATMNDNNIGSADNFAVAVNNVAASKLVQVGAAVSVGVMTGDGKSYALGDVAVVNNDVNNTVNAAMSDDTIYAGKVSSEAKDGKLSNTEEDNPYLKSLNSVQNQITVNKDGQYTDKNGNIYTLNANGEYVDKHGNVKDIFADEQAQIFDLDGSDAMSSANGADNGSNIAVNTTADGAINENSKYTSSKIEVNNGGNVIVGTALGLGIKTGGSSASAAAAVAVDINKVTNNFTSAIKGSSIVTNAAGTDIGVKAEAMSDTKIIGVADGVAANSSGDKTSIAAAGSGVKNSLNNDTKATVEISNIQTNKLNVKANNTSVLVNVAGQVSAQIGEKGAAAGLTWAENKLDNTTGVYVRGINLQGFNNASTVLTVAADNSSKTWAIGAGVAVSTGNGAVEGAVAKNTGKNNTEAIVGGYTASNTRNTIANADYVAVTATDNTVEKTVAGSIGVAAGKNAMAAVGGAVASTYVGNSAVDKQLVKAELNNSDISTANKATIKVEGHNNAEVLNLALGGAVRANMQGTPGISLEGSVGLTDVYTATTANMKDTNIHAVTDGQAKADVNLLANSVTQIDNSADAISVSAGQGVSVAGGAAVSVIKSDADTTAAIDGGTWDVNTAIAKATSDNKILDVAIGLGVSGSSAASVAVSGNVAVNKIDNDTTVNITNAAITAQKTIGALAASTENIKNYGGALSVAGAGNVGVAAGTTVVTNTILGDTKAVVSGSNLTGYGNNATADSLEVNEYTVGIDGKVTAAKAKNAGIVVVAEAEHNINDISMTGAAGASGSAGIAADVTAVMNRIEGTTGAEVINSNINRGATGALGDVTVSSHDKANISSHVGTLSVGAAGTAGVGLAGAASTNTLNREAAAKVIGSETRSAFNAHNANVYALGESLIHVSETGVAAGVSGAGGAAVSASVSVDKFTGNTTALVSNAEGNVNTLNIDAERAANVKTYNNAISLSGGIGSGSIAVGVTDVEDISHTNAELSNAIFTAADGADSKVNVLANNNTNVETELSADSLAISIGGSIGVAVENVNMEAQTGVKVKDAVIGAKDNGFGAFNAKANNILYNKFQNIDIAAASALGAGVGTGVQNINSATTVEVDDVAAYAKNVTVSADETRTLENKLVGVDVGLAAIGVNLMYTNIGTNLKDSYKYDKNGDGKQAGSYHTSDIQSMVNNALSNTNAAVHKLQNREYTRDAGVARVDDSMNKGNLNGGIKATVTGSALNAADKLDVHTHSATNTNISVEQATIGLVGVSVSTSHLDVKDELSLKVDNAKLYGKDVTITSQTDGTLKNYLGQGGVIGGGYNDTTGYVTHSGTNKISINGSDITALGAIADNVNPLRIEALNNNKIDNAALSVNIAGLSGGRLILEGEDKSAVAVELGKSGTKENGFTATGVTVRAYNAPEVKDEIKASVSVSGISGTGSIVTSKASGSAKLDTTQNNVFASGEVNLSAVTGSSDSGGYTTEARNHAVAVSGVDVAVNKVRTYNNMEAAINVGAARFMNGADSYGDVSIGAANASTSYAYIHSVNVAGAASGNNFAQTHAGSKVRVEVDGRDGGINTNDLKIYAANSDNIESKAAGVSVALIDISPYAAQVENTVNTTTNVDIKGKITAQGNFTAQALRKDEVNLNADALSVTVAGGGDAHVATSIVNNTNVNVNDAAISSGSDMLIEADNDVIMNRKAGYEKMVQGQGYAGLAVNTSGIDNTIKSTAHITLNNAKLDSFGNMKLIAHSNENMGVNGYVYSTGAINHSANKVINTITNDEAINLTNSELRTKKTGKDLILSAADDIKLFTYSYAESPAGVAAGTYAVVNNNLTRDNKIALNGSKNILYSFQDINLYAGKLANGNVGTMDLDIEAANFNGAIIPAHFNPSVNNSFKQNNQITMDTGSSSSSIRHTNIYASQGREMVRSYTSRYLGIYGNKSEGAFVTSDKGEIAEGKNANNYVNLNGYVVAGAANKIDITIGKTGDIVILDPELRQTVKDAKDKNDIAIVVDADSSTGITKNSLIFGSDDYTNTLLERYQELNNLMLEYLKDGKDNAAYLGYKAEADRIKQEMLSMGLAELDQNGVIIPKASLAVDYVEIPELASSGGNITVDTDIFSSSEKTGSVKAQGTPEINITNNTNLMLKVNAASVDDPGGKLIFNGESLNGNDTAAFNESIGHLNKNSDGTGFTAVEAADGQSGKITILGNYNGDSITYKGSFVDDQQHLQVVSGSMKPVANILLQGNIYAKDGAVNIKSAADSIVIQGKEVKDVVAVSGASVTLEAAQGSITQGYTNGIVNIGGSVQDQYNDAYKNAINTGNSQAVEQIKTSITDGSAGSGSYIAGGTVYINASDINVNGVIQSGFGDYYADISGAAVAAAIDKINQNYNGTKPVSDAVVTSGEQYKIINGGAVWDAAAGCYKYKLNVYYNPSTKKILVQNVNASGGKIYLTGRISSTGNGKIVCLDGVSDITVNNKLKEDLQLGDLTTGDVSGLVSITDTSKMTQTEIASDKVVVTNLDEKGQPGVSSESVYSSNYQYQPREGLKYTWTTGKQTTSYKRYKVDEVDGGWGLWSNGATNEELANWSTDGNYIDSGEIDNANRLNGETIRVDTSSAKSAITVTNKKLGEDTVVKEGERKYSTGLWGYHKHYEVTWTKTTGTLHTYDASIKADNPIGISFVGHKADDGKITVDTTQNINLTGNIGNTKLYETKTGDLVTGRSEKGSIAISSSNGAITQTGGSIYGADIALSAAKDIKHISITAGDTVNLSTVHHMQAGSDIEQNSIDVTVSGAYLAKGNVRLGAMGSVVNNNVPVIDAAPTTGITGLVSIATTGAEGNISQQAGNVIVADRIDLTSNNGSIYGQKNGDGSAASIKVYAGQQPMGLDTLDASVNATANGNINIEQVDGNMRVGRIYSKNGDVTLTVNGSVEDALPYVSSDRGDTDDMLARWRNVGIIAGNDEMTAIKSAHNAKAGLQEYKTWDANALLYAIQDSVVNQSSENLPKTSSKDPNVIGHNITLNVGDSAGLNSGNKTKINTGTLLDKDANGNYLHLDDLKTLSKADASTVTWEKDGDVSYAIITETLPIGVQQTTKLENGNFVSGKLTVQSAAVAGSSVNGDIFIQGRGEVDTDTSKHIVQGNVTKDLHLGGIATNVGDVRLNSLGGIFNAATDSSKILIKGNSLYITAAGSLGALQNKLTTDLKAGDVALNGLSAVAGGGIYIDQKGSNNLIVRNISSGADIYLGADKSLVMGVVNDADALNYVRAENNGDIELEARGGSIGEAEKNSAGEVINSSNKGIRILNTVAGSASADDPNVTNVILKAADNVYITGVASANGKEATEKGPAGILNLNIQGINSSDKLDNIGIVVDGALQLDSALDSSETASVYTNADLSMNKNISSQDIYLGSKENIILDGSAISANNRAYLEADGNILLQKGGLTAKNLDMLSLGFIDESYDNSEVGTASSSYNLKVDGTLQAVAGGSAPDALGIDLGSRYNQLNKVILDSDNGNITLGNGNNTEQDLDVSVQSGKIVNGNILIHNYLPKAGSIIENDVVINDSLKATGDIDIINNKGDIYNFSAIKSINGAVTVKSSDNVFNIGDSDTDAITAKGNVSIAAGWENNRAGSGEIWNTAKIHSEGDIILKATDTVINLIDGDNSITRPDDVTGNTSGDIVAGGKVEITTSYENKDDGDADSYYGIYNSANITSSQDVIINSRDSLINLGDIISKGGYVDLDATGDVVNGGKNSTNIVTGNISAKDNVYLTSWQGDVSNVGNIISIGGEVVLESAFVYGSEFNNNNALLNNITNAGSIKAFSDVTLYTLNGNVANKNTITSASGSVSIVALENDNYDGSNGEAGHITNSSGITDITTDITASAGITLDADGGIVNDGNYKTIKGDINVTAENVIGNFGNCTIKEEGNITVRSKSGDVLNVGAYSTQKGNINITVDKGDVLNNSKFYTGAGDITIKADTDVYNFGVMETSSGDINLTAVQGSLYNQAGADMLTGNGNITLEATGESNGAYYFTKINTTTGEIEEISVAPDKIQTYTSGDKAGSKYFVDEANVEHDVVKHGSVYNAGDAMAMAGTITIKSAHGDVTNYDDFNTLSALDAINEDTQYYGKDIATGNIAILAEQGTLYNTYDLESGENITLTAKNGLSNFAYNVYAGKDIALTATNGNIENTAVLESVAGNVTLTAVNGNVINGASENDNAGDIITLGGTVTLKALGKDASGNGYDVTNFGDIIAVGDAVNDALGSGSILLKSQYGNVNNYDDFNTYSKASSDGINYERILNKDKHSSVASVTQDISYNIATSNITLSAREGEVYNSKDYLVALGDVSLEAKTGLGSFGQTIYAGKNVNLTATDDDLINKAQIVSVDGNVTLNAENGTVVNMLTGDLVALNGNVFLKAGAAAEENHTVYYVDTLGNKSTLVATDSNVKDHILVTDKYYFDGGQKVDINNKQVVPSGQQVYTDISYFDDNNNKVVLQEKIAGDVEAYRQGDVVNRGDIISRGNADEGKGAITLDSLHGNVTNYDDFKLIDGKNTYDYLGKTGAVRFNPDTPYYYDEKGILLSDSDLNINAPEGYVYNNMDIVSDRDVTLVSSKDFTVGTNVSSITARGDIVVQSTNGKVFNGSSIVSKEGNIILDGYNGVFSTSSAEQLQALNGSISVVSTYGEVNVRELTAGETAAAGSANGIVKLGTINGKDVVLYTGSTDSTISADKLVVAEHLVLQGNHISLPQIERSNSNGTLVVDASGARGGMMKGDLNLQLAGDVRFSTINVANAAIDVGGKLSVDKVHVGAVAHFNSLGYSTGIYGVAPSHDSSNALYHDLGDGKGYSWSAGFANYLQANAFGASSAGQTLTNLHQFMADVDASGETFNKDNQGWMNLYVDGPRIQRSNGILLHIDTGYNSSNQRWSAEDLSAKLLDYKPIYTYREHFGDTVPFMKRYNILELPVQPVIDLVNAKESDIYLQEANEKLPEELSEV